MHGRREPASGAIEAEVLFARFAVAAAVVRLDASAADHLDVAIIGGSEDIGRPVPGAWPSAIALTCCSKWSADDSVRAGRATEHRAGAPRNCRSARGNSLRGAHLAAYRAAVARSPAIRAGPA